MHRSGWKTLCVETSEKLSLRNGCILAENREGETQEIPISELNTCIVHNVQCRITTSLLNALAEHNVRMILCDKGHSPSVELLGIRCHSEHAGRIQDQCSWSSTKKDLIWEQIIENKIQNQETLLDKLGRKKGLLSQRIHFILPGDRSNREGQAARLYFSALFGSGFRRHTDDTLNAALNYGYAILRTAIDRILVSHGYSTAIGIHHCSRQNPFNLSCDLMEPFRPFVDRIVYQNRHSPWNGEMKRNLLYIMQEPILFGGEKASLELVLEKYSSEVMCAMEGKIQKIRGVEFAP